MAETQAEWPIRAGGEYRTKPTLPHQGTYRAIAVVGGQVYYLWHSDTLPGFTVGDCEDWIFRGMVLPEDQSPIPALVAALKHCGGYLMTARRECQPEWLAGISEIIEEADAAIALAEARP